MSGPQHSPIEESTWPDRRGPYVLLMDASSSLEAKLIAEWFERIGADIGDPVDVY